MKVLNWTGWAIHKLPATVQPALQLVNKPLLPDHIQTYETHTLLTKILETFCNNQGHLCGYFQTSFCELNKVYNVPLKPYRIGPQVLEEDLKRLEKHLDGLTNFIPVELIEHNVGSNVGLARVLVHLEHSYKFQNRTSYTLCKVDVNIFWRLYLVSLECHFILESFALNIVKLLYSKVDPLKDLKNKIFIHLGWWHPYKYANELL